MWLLCRLLAQWNTNSTLIISAELIRTSLISLCFSVDEEFLIFAICLFTGCVPIKKFLNTNFLEHPLLFSFLHPELHPAWCCSLSLLTRNTNRRPTREEYLSVGNGYLHICYCYFIVGHKNVWEWMWLFQCDSLKTCKYDFMWNIQTKPNCEI